MKSAAIRRRWLRWCWRQVAAAKPAPAMSQVIISRGYRDLLLENDFRILACQRIQRPARLPLQVDAEESAHIVTCYR